MARGMNIWLGWILIVVGLIGLPFSGFLGMHLSPVHDVVLIVTGLISLYFGGPMASYMACRTWSIIVGLVYGIISLVGLLSGPGTTMVAPIGLTHNLLVLSPGVLEFGTGDNWWQLLAGVLFLISGFTSDNAAVPAPGYRHEEQAINR